MNKLTQKVSKGKAEDKVFRLRTLWRFYESFNAKKAAFCLLLLALLTAVFASQLPKLNPSKRHFYRLRGEHMRSIAHGKGTVSIHQSVKDRFEKDKRYAKNAENLRDYVEKYGWPNECEK